MSDGISIFVKESLAIIEDLGSSGFWGRLKYLMSRVQRDESGKDLCQLKGTGVYVSDVSRVKISAAPWHPVTVVKAPGDIYLPGNRPGMVIMAYGTWVVVLQEVSPGSFEVLRVFSNYHPYHMFFDGGWGVLHEDLNSLLLFLASSYYQRIVVFVLDYDTLSMRHLGTYYFEQDGYVRVPKLLDELVVYFPSGFEDSTPFLPPSVYQLRYSLSRDQFGGYDFRWTGMDLIYGYTRKKYPCSGNWPSKCDWWPVSVERLRGREILATSDNVPRSLLIQRAGGFVRYVHPGYSNMRWGGFEPGGMFNPLSSGYFFGSYYVRHLFYNYQPPWVYEPYVLMVLNCDTCDFSSYQILVGNQKVEFDVRKVKGTHGRNLFATNMIWPPDNSATAVWELKEDGKVNLVGVFKSHIFRIDCGKGDCAYRFYMDRFYSYEEPPFTGEQVVVCIVDTDENFYVPGTRCSIKMNVVPELRLFERGRLESAPSYVHGCFVSGGYVEFSCGSCYGFDVITIRRDESVDQNVEIRVIVEKVLAQRCPPW